MKNLQILLLVFFVHHLSFGQHTMKKTMDENVFAIWKTIESPAISNDGKWVVYQLQPHEGDPKLKVFNTKNEKEYTFERGGNAQLTDDSKFLVFKIKPPVDSIKMMKRQKVKKNDLTKDTLGIYDLEKGSLVKIPNVKSFQVPEKWNGHMVYHQEIQTFEKSDTTSIRPKKKETKDTGTQLTIRDLNSGVEKTFTYVNNYQLAEEGAKMLFSSTGNDSTFLPGVYRYDFGKKLLQPLHRQKGDYKKLTFNKNGSQAAFLSNVDTTDAQIPPFRLHYFYGKKDSAEVVFTNENMLLQKEWIVSEHAQIYFSENSKRLFFGVAPPPILQDTMLLDEEIVEVEVWSYTDKELYTQQEVRLESEKKRSYLIVFDVQKKTFEPIGNLTVDEVRVGDEGNANVVLGYDQKPYYETISWEGGPSYKDLYIKELGGSNWRNFAKKVRGTPRLSPQSNYVYWYSNPDTAWYAYSIKNRKITQITNNKISKFYDEINDRPMHPSSYSIAGWSENDAYILIYDRYDIWKVQPEYREPPVRLTRGREAADPTVFRYVRLDPEERWIDLGKEMFIHFFQRKSKKEGYGKLNSTSKSFSILTSGDYSYTRRVRKSRDENVLLYSKESFQVFPDMRIAKDWNFKNAKKISEANPQQSEYQWGTIEPYTWTSLDGQQLNGMLVKPEGFDPNKKYPMIVNFYEKSSDRIHSHRAPYPHRSTINYTYYSNRGYLIFNPDIPYRNGYPGESAYNAVIPGVTSLIEKGFVDADNIGVQGHSWGGYQIAYLVTKSNIFKCAESGAPVVNMISAYGGIRWGSGMSRQFQYEHTQSRIGGTIWEYPIRYIENSPIFFIDKIETPLLIMHNDKDSAVPWYQGIEFFTALRRLGKPAWMLNYNGEPHWPLKIQNRKDFNLRMQQFFDHYLQAKPKPMWMKRGVPAMEKGILQGFGN